MEYWAHEASLLPVADWPLLLSGAKRPVWWRHYEALADREPQLVDDLLAAVKELGPEKVEIVVPPRSILAEPPVAIVDKNVDRHGTRKAAQAYLDFLYTPEGQTLAAKHHFRPANPQGVPAALLAPFPQVKTVTVDSAFGGWKKAQATHFADGAFFDQLYKPGR